MSKDKKIICNTCRCTSNGDKLKVTCTGCENDKEITIVCEDCNCVDNSTNDSKEICLKGCNKNSDTIYITCTEYEEDLD